MQRPEIIRDPAVLAELLKAAEQPLALALDLGTATGYSCCRFNPAEPVTADRIRQSLLLGQFDLSAGQYDSGASRFVKLRQLLYELKPAIIFYEQVRNTPPIPAGPMTMHAVVGRVYTAAKLAGAFTATVCTWAEERNIPCIGLEIGPIKKRATGKGNASKADMIAAANLTFGLDLEAEGYETSGMDNVADSVHILLLGLEQHGNGCTPEQPA